MDWKRLPYPEDEVVYNSRFKPERSREPIFWSSEDPKRRPLSPWRDDYEDMAVALTSFLGVIDAPEVHPCFGYDPKNDKAVLTRRGLFDLDYDRRENYGIAADRTINMNPPVPEYITGRVLEQFQRFLIDQAPDWRIIVDRPFIIDLHYISLIRFSCPPGVSIAVYPWGLKMAGQKEPESFETVATRWRENIIAWSTGIHELFRKEYEICKQRLAESPAGKFGEATTVLGVFDSMFRDHPMRRIWTVEKFTHGHPSHAKSSSCGGLGLSEDISSGTEFLATFDKGMGYRWVRFRDVPPVDSSLESFVICTYFTTPCRQQSIHIVPCRKSKSASQSQLIEIPISDKDVIAWNQ